MARRTRTTWLAAAALAASLPASAALAADSPPPAQTAASQAQAVTAQMKAATEKHIADLKTRLKITPAQEGAWDNFAGVMRQNADEMSAKLESRSSGFEQMNAVQDLQSYADVTELHAQEISKLVSSFQPLYDSFSSDQKALADRVFRNDTMKATRRHLHG